MPANLKNSAVTIGLEKVSFHSNPKERQCQSMLKLPHNCTISHAVISQASKVKLKILQATLQQYVNHELPDVQVGFRKGRGTEIKLPTSAGSSQKQESSRKTSTSASLITLKPLTVWITTNWRILQEMGRTDHLTCLLGRKVMTNIDSILKSRDITLST